MSVVPKLMLAMLLTSLPLVNAQAQTGGPPPFRTQGEWSLRTADGSAEERRGISTLTIRPAPGPDPRMRGDYRYRDLSDDASRFRPSAAMLGIIIRF